MQGKVLPERSAQAPVYVGIDVCKDRLDVYLQPLGHTLSAANSRDGLRRLKRILAGHRVALVVMEATGKYHRQAHRTLHAAGLAVAVMNPLRARLFAEAAGMLAKTDKTDARMLAILGECLAPTARPPAPEIVQALQELVRARGAATAELTALKNRRHAAQLACLRAEIETLVESCQRHVARLETMIEERIKDDPGLEHRYTILQSIPSFGPNVAAALLVELPELGSCSGKAASLLAGLAPIACDSGDKAGERHIKAGRACLRAALYMAAITATRVNPDLAAFYKRLRANGKKAKVALTAVMRKLVILANTLVTQDRTWQPVRP
jgi:transposase